MASWNANLRFIAISLGVVVGVGLTVLMARAFYINYVMSRARRTRAQSVQQGLSRELSMRERRQNRRIARSGRARGDYYDLESGLREPPPVHLSADYVDPLPLYELPPEYSAIAKPGQRRVEIPSDDPIPYDQIDLYQSTSFASSSSSASSASASSAPSSVSSQHAMAPIREDPPLYSLTVR
ncbi:hypothetical protein Dda_2861 [Drechslerella dactyloides]|uniref:Uncharacterized protein n=1 Tax=Drechslerella dactyloides TaxID=74499 RepID=A0AAD6NMA0_DREDA|nr:hypothetical protein Dda_2861 [Drechslerella dactyloides]